MEGHSVMRGQSTFLAGKRLWCPTKFILGALVTVSVVLVVVGISVHFVERKEGYKLKALCLNSTCYFSNPSLSIAVACTNVMDCLSASVSAQWQCTNDSECLNGDKCIREEGGSRCRCPQGFSGVQCEVPSPCTLWNCSNGGTCMETETGPVCMCADSFWGTLCETKMDHGEFDCGDGACLNGDTCTLTPEGRHCKCPPSHFGVKCEYRLPREIRAIFVGNFSEGENITWEAALTNKMDRGTKCIHLRLKDDGGLVFRYAIRQNSTWSSDTTTLYRLGNQTSFKGNYDGSPGNLTVHVETEPVLSREFLRSVNSTTPSGWDVYLFVDDGMEAEFPSFQDFERVNRTECARYIPE